jgi:hypothetical protein
MMTRQPAQRIPWFAIVLGLLIGTGGGLVYAWLVNPVNLVDVAPFQLVSADQEAYIVLISEAYMQDRDLHRARARLEALEIRDPAVLLSDIADTALLNGHDPREIRALATLAEALGGHPQAAELGFTGTIQPTIGASTPTPTFEGVPTLTPTLNAGPATATLNIPTSTPTPDFVQETDFDLISSDRLCDDDHIGGLIEVLVYNDLEEGIPGLLVKVEWEGQEDNFYTGLKPDISPGYADFLMEPNKLYTVILVGLAEPVVGTVDSAPCTTDSGERITPTFQLVFAPAPDLETEEPFIETPAP